ncbi:hypothetical protein SAMD00019534_013450 [Acytostelium subglobosum LB1]|nr:hypothetical protein SAMD00019534_013450 [Acytostelium subglobosum LB1]GAM18170.1 hypothetical protein SAMD00019534_013450 [Acytostelium subglobosum LB1]|eukprot:XP_012758766.1 hypothetical protein SAMD00019534_013450 [Acytostelium subglobosum LB1]
MDVPKKAAPKTRAIDDEDYNEEDDEEDEDNDPDWDAKPTPKKVAARSRL